MIKTTIRYFIELGLIPFLLLVAICSRFKTRKIDIGLGPAPLINNIYHKKALQWYGYTAETFVIKVFFITNDFDIRGDLTFFARHRFLRLFLGPYLFIFSLLRYKCLYLYFNGGSISVDSLFLWRIEPILYKIANMKIVIMPFGSDVQEMSRSPNLIFKHVLAHDYPRHRLNRGQIAARIDLWTKYADHIIGGCEWVDYMYHWDTLMLAHFSIDVDLWKPIGHKEKGKLKILHAPNHRAIKGSEHFMRAVNELIEEGLPIELLLLEGVPNSEIRRVMASVDIVADQLIIGWYAMFALEAMAMEIPVLCYLRDDLKSLYVTGGLVEPNEIPIINCTPLTVKEVIRDLVLNRDKLAEIGKRSRQYVIKHHSTQAVGSIFDVINCSIGIEPSMDQKLRQSATRKTSGESNS